MNLTQANRAKWQTRWEAAHVFEADPDPKRQKIMVTFPLPYMNGPLHVGHAFSASRVDASARFKRMQGFNTLWPWAWHWLNRCSARANALQEVTKLSLKFCGKWMAFQNLSCKNLLILSIWLSIILTRVAWLLKHRFYC